MLALTSHYLECFVNFLRFQFYSVFGHFHFLSVFCCCFLSLRYILGGTEAFSCCADLFRALCYLPAPPSSRSSTVAAFLRTSALRFVCRCQCALVAGAFADLLIFLAKLSIAPFFLSFCPASCSLLPFLGALLGIDVVVTENY